MRIKLEAKSKEEMDAAIHGYLEEEDGAFFIETTKIPDVSNLNGALSKERDAVKTLTQRLKAFEEAGLGTPEAIADYKALKEQKAKLEREAALHGKTLEEKLAIMTADMQKAHQREIEGLAQKLMATEQERDTARQEYRNDKIRAALRNAAVAAKIPSMYHDDVEMRAGQFTLLDDGRTVVQLGEDGQPRRSSKDATKHVTPDEWLYVDMTKAKPGWFPGNSGGGGGGGNRVPGTGPVISRADMGAFSANIDKVAKGDVTVV